MTAEPTTLAGLDDVLRLATALSDQVLDAQIMGRPVPQGQVAALAKAARVLTDHDVPWPPMLTQALHGLAAGMETAEPAPAAKASAMLPEAVTRGLSRFFARPKNEPEEP